MAKKKRKSEKAEKGGQAGKPGKLSYKEYEDELWKLQAELVKLQLWVQETGARAIVVFEGRDAAGKGGVIKRITDRVSPRVFRVVALPAPSEREKTQMHGQHYITQFPAAGEVVIFDRSWYNRAGVERVMGFCSEEEAQGFLKNVPVFERWIVEDGIHLIKYWFDVGMDEQEKRFRARIEDPRKLWKLSPMDVESFKRWYTYSRARDDMLAHTDTEHAPWHIVRADNKKKARLNCISHLLSCFPYKEIKRPEVKLGRRNVKAKYDDVATLADRRFVPEVF